jgi:Skp family chaperone for outer membrane proteins
MRKITRLTLFTTVCLISTAVTGLGLKIAMVDMTKVTKSVPETKAAEAILEKQAAEFEAEHKGMLDELEQLKTEFETARKDADNKALSEQAREAKIKIAEDKLRELKEQDARIRETVKKRRQQINDQKVRMKQRIVGKLRSIVQDYAEDEGYTIVLDSSGVGLSGIETVVYSVDKIDITQDVLDIIEKQNTK